MRGLIRDCFENSRVCTRILGLLRIASPIRGKNLDSLNTSFNHGNILKLYQNARGEHE